MKIKDIYIATAVFVLYTLCTFVYANHILSAHTNEFVDSYFFFLIAVYLLGCFTFIQFLILKSRSLKIKRFHTVVNAIAKNHGIQFTAYIVNKRCFINLNKKEKNENSKLTPEEVYKMIYPLDLALVKEMVSRLDKGKNEIMSYEYRMNYSFFKNGYSWRQVSIYPYEIDDNGKVLTYIGVDISNDKAHEMMKSIDLFNKKILFISSVNSVVYIQYDRRIHKFFRLDDSANKSSHEIPLESWFSKFHPDDLHLAKELLDFMDRGEDERVYSEYRYKYPDQYAWFSVNIAAYEHDDEGHILTYLCLCSNVDKKHRELEQEKQLRRKADAANELKSRFIQNLSHEIRTPLNAIVGFSSEMSKDLSDEQAESFKEIIQRNNRQLLSIIDYTLNKSLFESGFAQIALVPVSLKSFLEETYGMTSSGIPRNLEYKMECEEPDITVTTDKSWLIKVIEAFIRNASNFTSSGSITLGYNRDQNGVRIFVKDTGIGIAKSDQHRIFKDFEKVNPFTPGLGMGLSMCKTVVTQLGGCVGVESQLAKGSCFWVWLPC